MGRQENNRVNVKSPGMSRNKVTFCLYPINSNSFNKLLTNMCYPPHKYAYIHTDYLRKDMQHNSNSSCPWGREPGGFEAGVREDLIYTFKF